MWEPVNHPDSVLSIALSYVPFFTPVVMMNRIAAEPPPGGFEVVFTIAWLLLWIFLFMKGAAKVFRTGILLYGKPPKLGEIIRWARAS
jgi:ABC-2 type transport system permease protein